MTRKQEITVRAGVGARVQELMIQDGSRRTNLKLYYDGDGYLSKVEARGKGLDLSSILPLLSGVNLANIQTETGTNILIDKLTQSAYTGRNEVLSNDNDVYMPTAPPASLTATTYKGKFFPRGCRGNFYVLYVYCKRTGAGTLTLSYAPTPCMDAVGSVTITPDADWNWKYAGILKFWNYDSIFIWVSACSADVSYGYDAASPNDGFGSTDSGVTWDQEGTRYFIRPAFSGQTVGDLPVSGTVNVIPYPNDVTIARPQWYDRNPAQKIYSFYDSGTLPHAETSRNSYTVPADQNLYLESALVKVMRLTAATVLGWIRARITIDGVTISDAWLWDNNVGAQQSDNLRQGIIILSGSVIVLYTTDTSTDGTTKLELCYKGTLFDE